MRLSFRFQYLLAPAVIILLLAGLVAYILIELPHIQRENETTRQWEMVTDRVQVLVAVATRLDQLAVEMTNASPGKRDDMLFEYIEQAQIYLENIQFPLLLERAPEDIRQLITMSATRLRDPERVNPVQAHEILNSTIPGLKSLYNEFLSQRRIAYIDYHRSLTVIIPRLIGASLTVLVLCIVVGVGLAYWGLRITRQRLRTLTLRAFTPLNSDTISTIERAPGLDEIDQLDQRLTSLKQRLMEIVAVEKVLQGVEDERRRIAMDMHDGVLADLTALSRRLGDATEVSHGGTELRVNLSEITQSIRRTIDDLHPQTLDILGLGAALSSFLDRQGKYLGGPTHHFDYDPAVENALTSSQKINFFRIATEAIHNVIRHAQCTRYEVTIRRGAHQIMLTVEDNGIGMPAAMPEIVTQGKHGCLNITERARAIGARTAWVASRFSSGTRLELNLPLISAS